MCLALHVLSVFGMCLTAWLHLCFHVQTGFQSDVQIWFQNDILADCAHLVTGSLGCAEGGSSFARCLNGIWFSSLKLVNVFENQIREQPEFYNGFSVFRFAEIVCEGLDFENRLGA